MMRPFMYESRSSLTSFGTASHRGSRDLGKVVPFDGRGDSPSKERA